MGIRRRHRGRRRDVTGERRPRLIRARRRCRARAVVILPDQDDACDDRSAARGPIKQRPADTLRLRARGAPSRRQRWGRRRRYAGWRRCAGCRSGDGLAYRERTGEQAGCNLPAPHDTSLASNHLNRKSFLSAGLDYHGSLEEANLTTTHEVETLRPHLIFRVVRGFVSIMIAKAPR